MTTTDLETYEGQLERLDRHYIREHGAAISRGLDEFHGPATLDYQPGNGTLYALYFVPVRDTTHYGSRRLPEGVDHDGGARWVLVVKCNGTDSDFAYPFDLTPGHVAHASYVAGHCRMNLADACAITALLRAIAGVEL